MLDTLDELQLLGWRVVWVPAIGVTVVLRGEQLVIADAHDPRPTVSDRVARFLGAHR